MSAGPRSLPEWLQHIGALHPVGIDMGLDRIRRVAARLELVAPGHRPAPQSVIVAGTNGKGSTCMALEALLWAAGRRVGNTLSPHVHRFNERVRIDGEPLDDAALCAAFATVEDARGDVTLTYFEFAALAALEAFRTARVDVAVLEVGLGGRLDAFNLVDADVAVITSIGLDHQEYLGDDLEGIGREKAGVLRRGQPVVLGARVTASVEAAAADLGCGVRRLGRELIVSERGASWDFTGTRRRLTGLPLGHLAPENCALAIEAADLLGAAELPDARVGPALGAVGLPGRLEAWRLRNAGDRLLLLDVAHNPAAAEFLAGRLDRRHPGRRFVAIFGALADKDAAGMAAALGDRVAEWLCVTTRGPRGRTGQALTARLEPVAGPRRVSTVEAPEALTEAVSRTAPGGGILAFGSFDLVEQIRDALLSGAAGAEPQASRQSR